MGINNSIGQNGNDPKQITCTNTVNNVQQHNMQVLAETDIRIHLNHKTFSYVLFISRRRVLLRGKWRANNCDAARIKMSILSLRLDSNNMFVESWAYHTGAPFVIHKNRSRFQPCRPYGCGRKPDRLLNLFAEFNICHAITGFAWIMVTFLEISFTLYVGLNIGDAIFWK